LHLRYIGNELLNNSIYQIKALLDAPNPDDPLDTNIAEHWKKDEVGAISVGT